MSARDHALRVLTRTLAEAARARARAEARRLAWPLPEDLRVHLWLYAEGLIGPTQGDASSTS